MKKLLVTIALTLASCVASAQTYADNKTNFSVEKNGGVASSGSNVGPYSGTPVLGDIIYFDGTNWVSLAKPADGTYSLTFTSSIPSWAASGGAPTNATYITQTANGTLSNEQATGSLATGLLLSTTTTGVLSIKAANTCTAQFARSDTASGVWTCASVNLAADVTGVLPYANFSNGAANSVVGRASNSSGVQADISPAATVGTLPQSLQYDGTTTAWNVLPFDTNKWDIISTSFWQHGASAGAAVINSFNVTFSGSGGGYVVNPALIPDANHPNFAEITTGTATTGGATLGVGTNGSSAVGNGLILSGGEVVDWLIYVPIISGGTNTHRIYAGFINNSTNSVPTDGAFITWDANTNANWAVETIKATTPTGPTASTTAGTAAAWHHLKVVVNSNATSIAFYVDGVQLSSSPLTTNIPTNVVFPAVKIVASAGCSSGTSGNAANCALDINTVYYVKPVTR